MSRSLDPRYWSKDDFFKTKEEHLDAHGFTAGNWAPFTGIMNHPPGERLQHMVIVSETNTIVAATGYASGPETMQATEADTRLLAQSKRMFEVILSINLQTLDEKTRELCFDIVSEVLKK